MANDKERAEMLKRVREKMLQKKGSRQKDPFEWKPPQVAPGKDAKFKAYVLPPLEKGEKCQTGKAAVGMDGLFYFQFGDHWINKKRYPCPRIYDNGDCPYCQIGFDLLNETEDKKTRSEISKAYLPQTKYAVNLYFPAIKSNPEELHGQVFYYSAPKTIFDKLEQCLNRDDGGEEDDPQSHGIFYTPEEAFMLTISIKHKGDYNNYEESKLAPTATPIADSPEAIKKLLDVRHDIPTKFPERSVENYKILKGFVNDLMNGQSEEEVSGATSGFDNDETSTEEAKPAPKPASKTKIVAEEEEAPKPSKESKGTKPASKKPVVEPEAEEDPDLQALINKMENE